MIDWKEQETIKKIQDKLIRQRPLDHYEIEMVVSALRKAHDYTQKPFYEIIYHDEYDRQERRIMNPISHNCRLSSDDENFLIVRDSFELHFNRIVPRKKDEENES